MSIPLNQNEGSRNSNPQVLDEEKFQIKNEFSTYFHNLKPSLGQALLKEVPKLKEWPHISGEGEYDHMEFIRGIDMVKEDFELRDRLVKARFDMLFTKSAHRWYIKLREEHGYQSWTWWNPKITNKWANDAWIFEVEKAFKYAKLNAAKHKALPKFCQKRYILTELYPYMSYFMIYRKSMRKCGGDLENSVKRRIIKKSSAEDIINILKEVTTKTRIGSSRVNLKERQIKVNQLSPYSLESEKFKSEEINEAEVSLHLTDKQENEIYNILYDHGESFETDKEQWGEITGHDFETILKIRRPYPPLLGRPTYPENPKSREGLEIHIKELLDLGVIKTVGHNEEVEITTPIIVAWNVGKFRMVGEFKALNTYTVPDMYPIPKIQIALTQISQAVYISTMNSLKGFHKNVVTPRARKYSIITVHFGMYEY
ncbi:hypothetical protein O181_008317 [Austropuccinia psidii MF-1]|uniref:Uncharacterized protein n=1 Tax=Austropuccinia psidii MF-1 TaxID=1389203 RepID=A0A9Q3BPI1_9BASI|nr:hypothetical protein [Austropuccinia psidii MF-1]